MEHFWSFELASTYTPFLNDLESFLGQTNQDFNISCIEDDFGYYYRFTSVHFDNIEKSDIVYSNGTQLIQLLNGVLFLIRDQAFKIRELQDLYKNNQRVLYEKLPVSGTFNFPSFTSSIVQKTGNPLADLLEISKANQNVLDLLFILGEEATYHKLYMVYETLKSIAGDTSEFEASIGSELKKVKAFTFVTNNFEAIGTQARHRNYKLETPKNPMTLTEAKDLIKTLAHLVIEKYLGINLPFIEEPKWGVNDLF